MSQKKCNLSLNDTSIKILEWLIFPVNAGKRSTRIPVKCINLLPSATIPLSPGEVSHGRTGYSEREKKNSANTSSHLFAIKATLARKHTKLQKKCAKVD